MNMTPPQSEHRLTELLAERALFGLDADESAELDSLAAGCDHDCDEFDRLVASIYVDTEVFDEPMPSGLQSRIRDILIKQASGAADADDSEPSGDTAAVGAQSHFSADRQHGEDEANRPSPRTDRYAPPAKGIPGREMIAWMFTVMSVAALVVAAIFVLTPEPPIGQRLARLQDDADDLVHWPWVAQADPAVVEDEVEGEVYWSSERQEGYMVFKGLAENDPKKEQYQLWIFDRTRRDPADLDQPPVDGGVFDVTYTGENGEAIIKINPKLPIGEPMLFAVTVEKPGGVVVSSRERLPVLAQPPTPTKSGDRTS